MVKATGRFPILNIEKMIREFMNRNPLELAVDVVEHNLYKALGLKWAGSHVCRTIIYACDCAFYKENIYGRYAEIPKSFCSAETLMRDVWEKNKTQVGVWGRFKNEPKLSGFAGGVNCAWITANNYDSFLSAAKRNIRQICRWLLPNLWL